MFAKFHLEERVLSSPATGARSAEVDDVTLWQRFKSGNELAFSILYGKYVQRLYNYGMHAAHDHDLVMDCLQELFGRLWDKRAHLGEVIAVHFYLYKSFRRLLLGRIIQRRKYSFIGFAKDTPGFEIHPSVEDSWIIEEIGEDRAARLKKAIRSLTRRQREAIFLKFYNELSYAEVAAVMEMSVDSVYNLVSKAIDSLRKILKGTFLQLSALFSITLVG
jgi:RNA polymerase sigma factor (sigma-70 family)